MRNEFKLTLTGFGKQLEIETKETAFMISTHATRVLERFGHNDCDWLIEARTILIGTRTMSMQIN